MEVRTHPIPFCRPRPAQELPPTLEASGIKIDNIVVSLNEILRRPAFLQVRAE